MVSRRQFLINSGGLGAWVMIGDLARRIARLARESREPYVVRVERPAVELWANVTGDGDYLFTLGCRDGDTEEPHPTWGEWLELEGVDISRPKSVRDYLDEWGWTEGQEIYQPPKLEEKIPILLLHQYINGPWAMRDSPYAKAYSYLHGLGLGNRTANGKANGGLELVSSSGKVFDNSCWAEASGIETLGALQQRLLELGERVQLHVEEG